MPLRGCGAEQVKLDHEYQSLENIIVIQKDPLYQELWDLARLIACRNPINQTPNLMSKRIVFRPFISDNLDIISVIELFSLCFLIVFKIFLLLKRFHLAMIMSIVKSIYGWTSPMVN